MINFDLIIKYLPYLLRGTINSLFIAFCAITIGVIFGSIIGILHTSENKFIRSSITFYITIIRGTPMLIQLAIIFYLLSSLLALSPIFSAILAIGLNSAAYVSQIIKSGLQSISKGQVEAAKTLGFSRFQTIRYITFPQAFKAVMPALGNECITLVKDSSLASTIGVMELFKEAKNVINLTYDALSVYFIVAIIYLIITTIISIILKSAENRMSHYAKN